MIGVPSAPKATGAVLPISASPAACERLEAEADQHRRRDRDRRAEAGRAFDERAEAEGDEQRLDAAVRRERRRSSRLTTSNWPVSTVMS